MSLSSDTHEIWAAMTGWHHVNQICVDDVEGVNLFFLPRKPNRSAPFLAGGVLVYVVVGGAIGGRQTTIIVRRGILREFVYEPPIPRHPLEVNLNRQLKNMQNHRHRTVVADLPCIASRNPDAN